jgi:SAM-dependent methyltransferase
VVSEGVIMAEAVFDSVARFYDCEQATFVDDIPLYVEFAKRCQGHVLECACGTGRVLVPIAEAGVRITGFDISEEMLGVARKRIEELPKKARENITLVHADLTRFDLQKEFSLIFVAYRSFQSLVTREEQSAALECIHKHLTDDGVFILDLFAPRHDLLAQERRSVYLGRFLDKESGVYVTRRAEDQYNLAQQTLKEDRFYEWTDKDGRLHQHVWSFDLSYLFRYEAELLLEKHGFRVEDVFGDFSKSPYNYYSGEQIFVVRKR